MKDSAQDGNDFFLQACLLTITSIALTPFIWFLKTFIWVAMASFLYGTFFYLLVLSSVGITGYLLFSKIELKGYQHRRVALAFTLLFCSVFGTNALYNFWFSSSDTKSRPVTLLEPEIKQKPNQPTIPSPDNKNPRPYLSLKVVGAIKNLEWLKDKNELNVWIQERIPREFPHPDLDAAERRFGPNGTRLIRCNFKNPSILAERLKKGALMGAIVVTGDIDTSSDGITLNNCSLLAPE